jgi:biotin carboxyl carrier protein
MAKLTVPRCELRFHDQVVTATRLGDEQIRIAERTFRVEPIGGGFYRVSEGEQQIIVAVAGPPENRWISAQGAVALGEVIDASRPPRRRVARGGAQLTAPMPATVAKVLVEVGDEVHIGDTVIVLEAMKMELPIRAPADGIVRAVHCRPGDLVQPGVDLLEI